MHVKSSTETCVLCSRPQGRACFVQGLKGGSSRIAWLINGKKTDVDLWAMQRGWEGLETSARRQLGPYRLLPLSFYYTLRVLLPREFLSRSCIICVYRVYYYLLSSASSRRQRSCLVPVRCKRNFFCDGILLIWSTKWSLFTKLFAQMCCKSRDESNDTN